MFFPFKFNPNRYTLIGMVLGVLLVALARVMLHLV